MMLQFPEMRMRRSRRHEWSRLLVREHHLAASDLIWPVFLHEKTESEDVASMPGVQRMHVDTLIKKAGDLMKMGLCAIAVFPCIPAEQKDDIGSLALHTDFFLYEAIGKIKSALPEVGVIVDVALDPFTTHGHDGLVDQDGFVDNDRTCAVLCQMAKMLVDAGADVVAPSDMQDGRIGMIRRHLEENNHQNAIILAYSAKYASSFYGPFRDAVGSTGALAGKSKSHYQMDYHQSVEAQLEAQLDVNEGADWLMVKPGMPYLDVVSRLASKQPLPVFAYQVSGEYQMLMNLSADAEQQFAHVYESLIAFKRAGARAILTYATPLMLGRLSQA